MHSFKGDIREGIKYFQSKKYKVLYCDPPYVKSAVKHKASNYDFNADEFWEVVREWSLNGNIVVISEREAPDDFECIWSRNLQNPIKGGGNSYVDCLFRFKVHH